MWFCNLLGAREGGVGGGGGGIKEPKSSNDHWPCHQRRAGEGEGAREQ